MTPNEQFNTTPIKANEPKSAMGAIQGVSTICLLAGIWLFISPWVYGFAGAGNALNCWIVGGLIILCGIIRLARPAYSTVLSWCNMILGIWAFFSPWIYGYTGNQGRFINSLCVGVIVFVFAIASALMGRRAHPLTPSTVAH